MVVPDVTPALPLFGQLRAYTLAVLSAAETAADFAAVVYTDMQPEDGSNDFEPFDSLEIERRMMTTLPAGWKMGQFEATQPNTTYEMFKREILNEIARCLNMPYNVAAGNSSAYNYASGRLDHQTYFKAIRVEQAHLEATVLDRVLSAWLDEAVLIPGLLPDGLGPFAEAPHQFFFDGHEHVDPLKESSAQALRLANHTTTYADEYARRGLDWETQLRQRAKELGVSRRRFLQTLAAGGAATALSSRFSPNAWAQAAPTPVIKPTPKELFNDFGSNKEMRWENMYERGFVVPNELFFVRNHTRTPVVDVKKWRLKV